MKQAVAILAHKNFEHLVKIIESFDPDYSFYINIDNKSNYSAENIKQLRAHPRVTYISEFKMNWGSIFIVQSVLQLIGEILKDKDIKYAHLMSGQDFLVKSSRQLTLYLKENEGKQFMEYFKLPNEVWYEGGLNRLKYYYLFDIFKARTGILRRINNTLLSLQKLLGIERTFKLACIPIYGGRTWWSLSSDCLSYLYNYAKQNPDFVKKFRHVFCSDELLLPTILMNSHFAPLVVNNSLRYICWESRNGNYPANLDESDWLPIQRTNCFFARKFEYPVSLKLLKIIEERTRVDTSI
ncbi:beta-1,6-N-acetylglucosaminyltransferase [Desertivirga arenae]|uniref:beta-1,6-N-acetylglucosaminyltransferase n=1 Tax=Desertivirga arenae TaxID=2810309 RepID=UPI001A95ECE9|nr:beta-1,6-N-acetylglucosaminyltransferase [Pedobacter sp. SYSU D00823]